MKKKITALALAAVMVLGLTACGGGGAASSGTASTGAASSSTTDVAFVTDVGNIDDQSFNQYTWAGVQQFCDANGLNANYYKPSEDSDAARVEQMDNAVKDGAKVIVMAGYLFAPALEEAQAKYPDISFLALDVSTGDLAEPAANTALITYKEVDRNEDQYNYSVAGKEFFYIFENTFSFFHYLNPNFLLSSSEYMRDTTICSPFCKVILILRLTSVLRLLIFLKFTRLCLLILKKSRSASCSSSS